MKKLLWLIGLIAAVIFFEECKKDEIKDDEDRPVGCGLPPAYFLRKGMNIRHIPTDTLDNYGYYRHRNSVTDTSITISKSNFYALYVDYIVDFIARAKPGFSSFFFNTAYATPPCLPPGYKGAKDTISSIIITSDADFDSLHTAGKSLNVFFTTNSSYRMAKDSLQPSELDIRRRTFFLYLSKKPTLNPVHTFNVKIVLSNGDILLAKGSKVTFK